MKSSNVCGAVMLVVLATPVPTRAEVVSQSVLPDQIPWKECHWIPGHA